MFRPNGLLTIDSLLVWMDGGTVTLFATDDKLNKFKIEFTQKVFLKKRKGNFRPGSLILNEKEVEVRSRLEKEIIKAIEEANLSTRIDELDKSIIEDCIKFILSEDYAKMAGNFS